MKDEESGNQKLSNVFGDLNLLISFTKNFSIFRESIHSKFGKTNMHYKRDVHNPNHGKFLLSSTRKINTKNIKKYDYERARTRARTKALAREKALLEAEEKGQADVDMEAAE